MNHHRFTDDRIRAAQSHLALPIEMRFTGSIRLDIAQVTLMTLSRHRAAMLMLRRIEMRARRGRIRRGTIAFFMDMESMLAGLESGDVGHDLDVIAHFGERHRARDLAARL